MRKRPSSLPFGWIKLTKGTGLASYTQKRDWRLVLDSAAIDFSSNTFDGQEHIYVPALARKKAAHEINAFIRENRRRRKPGKCWPVYEHCWPVFLFLAPVIWIHGLRFQWWPDPSFLPPPGQWLESGSLNSVKILVYGQWERLATALCLHASLIHLVGNIVFGAIFMFFLARVCGSGRCALLTVLGGMAGNAISVALHTPGYQSIGFSTAVFACVGALAGIALWRMNDKRKIFMPLAAALGLLALLGVEGEHTDYAAHLSGLAAGCLLGCLEGWRIDKKWPGISQTLAAFLAVLIPAGAWILAFHSYAF